ncbi:hypothetical protein D9615_010113 [Tricholomella constricta]|uniref:CCHC-type domain-containing protein n=1 Tax=Tricholomella constricta TaxID=117010 RepID=A0A8H5LWN2_9AGAR|nr:hypothetical protein D9615_010113 [Tricholomella constricta]
MSSTIVEPNTTIRYQNFEGPSFTQRRPSPPPFETSPASTGPPMQGTFGSNRSRLEHQIFQPGQHEGDFSSVSQDPRRPLPRTPSNVFNPSYQLATPNYPPLPPSATTSGPPLSSNQTPGSYYERLRHPEMFQRRDRAREEGQGQFARQQNPFLHGSDHERILYELRMTREEFSRQAHELLVETMGMDHQPRTPEQWANLVLSTMQLHEAHRLPPQLTVLLQMGGNERRLHALAGEIQTSNEGRRFSDPQSAGRSFHMPIQEPVPSRIETRFEEPPRATSTVNTQTASALLRRMNQGNAPPSQEGFEPTVTPGADARRAPTFGFWGAHNLQRIPEENPPVEGPFSRPNSGFQGPQGTFANQEGVPPREPENIPLPPSERGIPTPLSYAHSYELREENSERREGAPPRAREDWRQTPPHLASQNRRSPQGPRPISPRERRGIGADPGPGQNVNILDGRQGTQQQFPQFEQYRTGYNPGPAPPIPGGRPNPQYNILNVLAIAPSPETYEGYRDLVTQIDRRYWEHRIENPESYKPLWANNANTPNTSARPPMGPSAGPASRTTPQTAQGNRNARLNAESHDQDPDSGREGKAQDQEIAWDDEEALQANNFGFKKSTRPWVKIDEDVKQQRIRDKACILCGDLEHWMRDCPTANAMGRATYLIGDDIFEFHHKTEEGNAGAIQDLPGL